VTGAARLHPGLVHHIVNTLGWPSLRPLQAAAITYRIAFGPPRRAQGADPAR